MKRIMAILTLLLATVATPAAQDLSLSASSHKQGAATAQNITATGAQTAIDTTGYSHVLITVRGTYGAANISFEASPNGTNYFPLDGFRRPGGLLESSTGSLTNTDRGWLINVVGYTKFRLNCTAISSGTVNATITPVAAPTSHAVASNWINPLTSALDAVRLGDASGNNVDVLTSSPTGTERGPVTRPLVVGDVANDSVDAGNPVKIGGVARTSDPAAVASGDRVNASFDTVGKQIVLPWSTPENLIDGTTAAISGTADTTILSAPGAGIRLYVTSVVVTNSHATVSTAIECKDGAGGTVRLRQFARADGGGFAYQPPTPIRLTANTSFVCACVTTGSNTYITATGYKAP